ncbi:hypothetical protein, partial [Pseudomonas amygdali]|uniref:hypothetical protein n=1 Tax=Pseudomonas amygdali TaxID=47877 RepID=UPI001C7EC2A5
PRRMPFRAALPRWSMGTITATIVRRSASHAFLDALRPIATQSVENCVTTLEHGNERCPGEHFS